MSKAVGLKEVLATCKSRAKHGWSSNAHAVMYLCLSIDKLTAALGKTHALARAVSAYLQDQSLVNLEKLKDAYGAYVAAAMGKDSNGNAG
jgi:hypothetical protein